MRAKGGELECREASWQSIRYFPTPSGHHHPLLIFASLLLPTEALYGLGATGSTVEAALSLEIRPEKRTIDILLWSAAFPGALLSTFLAHFGTFRL